MNLMILNLTSQWMRDKTILITVLNYTHFKVYTVLNVTMKLGYLNTKEAGSF